MSDSISIGTLVRSFLDFSPKARLGFFEKAKRQLPNDEIKEKLQSLHSALEEHVEEEEPWQLFFDEAILDDVSVISIEVVNQLLDFLNLLISKNVLNALKPIAPDEIKNIFESNSSEERKVELLMQRMGADRYYDHKQLINNAALEVIDITDLFPYSIIPCKTSRPESINEIPRSLLVNINSAFLLAPLTQIIKEQRNSPASNRKEAHERPSEIYEGTFNSRNMFDFLRTKQQILISQFVNNFVPNPSSENLEAITHFSVEDSRSIAQIIMHEGADRLRHLLTNPHAEKQVFNLPCGYEDLANLLNRLRKANLATIYEDDRFVLK